MRWVDGRLHCFPRPISRSICMDLGPSLVPTCRCLPFAIKIKLSWRSCEVLHFILCFCVLSLPFITSSSFFHTMLTTNDDVGAGSQAVNCWVLPSLGWLGLGVGRVGVSQVKWQRVLSISKSSRWRRRVELRVGVWLLWTWKVGNWYSLSRVKWLRLLLEPIVSRIGFTYYLNLLLLLLGIYI